MKGARPAIALVPKSTDCQAAKPARFALDSGLGNGSHVNYAWPSLAAVAYPRYPAGETFAVAAPNSRGIGRTTAPTRARNGTSG